MKGISSVTVAVVVALVSITIAGTSYLYSRGGEENVTTTTIIETTTFPETTSMETTTIVQETTSLPEETTTIMVTGNETSTTTIQETNISSLGENCCNGIDDDNDGYEDGYDLDCQKDMNLTAGYNEVCWWTEWDDYGNNRNYTSGWFKCPEGYAAENVNVYSYMDQYTLSLADDNDCLISYNQYDQERARVCGHGDSIKTDNPKTGWVKVKFISDSSGVEDGVRIHGINCILSENITNETTTPSLDTCVGTKTLNCTLPDMDIGRERIWGSTSCGRTYAEINCSGIHTVCADPNLGPCSIAEPTINNYTVDKTNIQVGESFSITVNGRCPSNLPGNCLLECHVKHPDGHWIELDVWDDDGYATMPSLTCSQEGVYTIDYCFIGTDFYVNSGWGIFNETDTNVVCKSSEEPTPTITTYPHSCTDTDGGENISNKGTVTYTDLHGIVHDYTDYCNNISYITEYYCLGTEVMWDTKACPKDYLCSGGQCEWTSITESNTTIGGVTCSSPDICKCLCVNTCRSPITDESQIPGCNECQCPEYYKMVGYCTKFGSDRCSDEYQLCCRYAKPSIDIQFSPTKYQYYQGDVLDVTVTATDDEGIDYLKLDVSYISTETGEVVVVEYPSKYHYCEGASECSKTWRFTLDKEGWWQFWSWVKDMEKYYEARVRSITVNSATTTETTTTTSLSTTTTTKILPTTTTTTIKKTECAYNVDCCKFVKGGWVRCTNGICYTCSIGQTECIDCSAPQPLNLLDVLIQIIRRILVI